MQNSEMKIVFQSKENLKVLKHVRTETLEMDYVHMISYKNFRNLHISPLAPRILSRITKNIYMGKLMLFLFFYDITKYFYWRRLTDPSLLFTLSCFVHRRLHLTCLRIPVIW